MITEGSFKILGGNNIFIIYLCNSNKLVKDKLYPADTKNEIEKHLAWFQARMKPSSTRLVKMIVQPQAFGEKVPPADELNREENEFFSKLLPSLDKQLVNKAYFCGNDITIADIQYFQEISTLVHLKKREITASEFPNLAPWYNDRLAKIPEVAELDKKLKEIIAKYNF